MEQKAHQPVTTASDLLRSLDGARASRGVSKAELARRSHVRAETVRRLLTDEAANPVLYGKSSRELSKDCGRMRRFDWRDLIGRLGQNGVFSPGFPSVIAPCWRPPSRVGTQPVRPFVSCRECRHAAS